MTATRGMHGALEGAAAYFDGAVINCMGMAAENMFSRPQTAVARNSDDFMPKREDGFAEHLLQNAYNTPYQGELYVCDWDMFWTSHEDGLRHSLLRAISGGPVYFSKADTGLYVSRSQKRWRAEADKCRSLCKW